MFSMFYDKGKAYLRFTKWSQMDEELRLFGHARK